MASIRWLVFCALACLITVQASHSSSFGLSKRSWEKGQPITVPLALDASGRPVVHVNMSTGSDTQHFGLAISTGTGYTMVAGSQCDSCSGVPTYNASKSTTAQSLAGARSVAMLNNTVDGPLYKEDCGMQTMSGGVWAYPNMTIVVANASMPVFSDGVSGVLGLGTNSRQGNFSDTIFGAYLGEDNGATSFQYGMALDAPDNSTNDGGVLHLLSPDGSAYTGNVSWKGVQQASSNADGTGLTSDWIIDLDGWSFAGGSGSISNTQGGSCTVDPYYPNVYIPQNLANEIYGSISGASQISDASAHAIAWTVPCDTKMSFTAVFGSESFTVDQSILVINQGDRCIGGIEGWSDSSLTGYLFGARFLSEVYVIFNIYGPNSSQPDTVGFAHRSKTSKKVLVGAIVGGTVGGVAFLVILCAAGFFIYRRGQVFRWHRKSEIQPFISATTRPSTLKDGSLFATPQQSQYPSLPHSAPSSADPFDPYFPGGQPLVTPSMTVQRITTSSQAATRVSHHPPSSAPPTTQSFHQSQSSGLSLVPEVQSSSGRPYSYPSSPISVLTGDAPPSYTPPEVQPRRPRKS